MLDEAQRSGGLAPAGEGSVAARVDNPPLVEPPDTTRKMPRVVPLAGVVP